MDAKNGIWYQNQLYKKTYVYWMFCVIESRHFDMQRNLLFAKVGIAEDVRERLNQVQTCCPLRIRLAIAAPSPAKRDAQMLEAKFKSYDYSNGERTSGEWFIVNGGKHDHSVFIHEVIKCFYLWRNESPKRLDSNMEWIATPTDSKSLGFVPGATEKLLTTSAGNRIQPLLPENELGFGVDAEIRGEAIAHLLHAELSEIKHIAECKRAALKKFGVEHFQPYEKFPIHADDDRAVCKCFDWKQHTQD